MIQLLSHNCFLLLGTNKGKKEEQLVNAIQHISRICGKVVTESPAFFSESWGYNDDTYLNQAIEISTTLSPMKLLKALQDIEIKMGREHKTTTHYEARTIDIDIILFENKIIDNKELTIPHPRMHLRNFVLQPLLTIAPKAKHPILNKTIEQLAKDCTDKGKVWKK